MAKGEPDELQLWGRSMVMYRPGRLEDMARPLAAVLRAAAAFSDRTAFAVRLRNMSAVPIAEVEETVAEAVNESVSASRRGREQPIAFATSAKRSLMLLTCSYDLASGDKLVRGEISFDLSKPLVGRGGHFTFDELVRLFETLTAAFEAEYAAVHDSLLLELVRSTAVIEAVKRQLPKREHKHVPVPAIVEELPAALVSRVTAIEHPESFDTLAVPEAVYWINYWSARQVATLGEPNVRKAPWEYVAPHSRGGLILATQKEPFDALDVAAVERIARIMEAVSLGAAQRRKR